MSHVKEAQRRHLRDSQNEVAKDELHGVAAQQRLLLEIGEPRSMTLAWCCRHWDSWQLTALNSN